MKKKHVKICSENKLNGNLFQKKRKRNSVQEEVNPGNLALEMSKYAISFKKSLGKFL